MRPNITMIPLPGYVSLDAAIQAAAKAWFPDRWAASELTEEESDLWRTHGNTRPPYRPKEVRPALAGIETKFEAREACRAQAWEMLRGRLIVGQLAALALTSERGVQPIEIDRWGHPSNNQPPEFVWVRVIDNYPFDNEIEWGRPVIREESLAAVIAPADPEGGVPSPDSAPKTISIAAQESKAISLLAEWFKHHPNATRKEALDAISAAGISVTPTGFTTRIWAKARSAAGLAERAAAGRRKRAK